MNTGKEAYVNLHRHDSYSLLDGVDVAERAATYTGTMLVQPALGLTNHGNIYGLVEHHFACKAAGVKPIHGCELYVTVGEEKAKDRKEIFHLTVLVQNAVGYQNLCKLLTLSYLPERFYYKNNISLPLLAQHGEGLIVLSGCPRSAILSRFVGGDAEGAEKLFAWFIEVFGGRFYAEIQHNVMVSEATMALVALSRKYSVPIVFTSDAHYVEKRDRVVHDLILKLNRGKKKAKVTVKAGEEKPPEKGEENPTYGDGFYLLGRGEADHYMKTAHGWLSEELRGEALDNTVLIAERCEFDMASLKPKELLPKLFDDAAGKIDAYALEGVKSLGLSGPKYSERLREELRVIHKLGYDQFFLVIHEVVKWAKSKGFLIGPRGSVCGSLLAFALGITEVDPLIHGTLFERFLYDEKKSAPDVDLDIDARYKGQVAAWVMKRFEPYALPIITFGRYNEANVANELGTEFNMLEDDRRDLREAIAKLHRNRVLVASTAQLRESQVVLDLEKKHPGIVQIVQKLYGTVSYIGQHPGGMAFMPDEPSRWMATVRYKDNITTCYHMVDVERLGLLKFDFLGLTAMGTIQRTVDYAKERYGHVLRLKEIPLDDKPTLDLFTNARTDGVFQFDTDVAKGVLHEIEPTSFKEIVASNALNRPGVSDNIHKYAKAKEGGKSTGLFGETYGIVVYQEDILLFLKGLGFTWQEGDAFLKAIKGVKRWDPNSPILQKFVDALMVRGAEEEKAKALLNRISRYSFNKAHAVGYSLVAYWTAWLRVHYTLEFWASAISMEKQYDKVRAFECAAARDGIVIMPAHVNGGAYTGIEGDGIRLGLSALKDVGTKAAEAIGNIRRELFGGQFNKAVEIAAAPKRVVNAKVIAALERSGALEFDEQKLVKRAFEYNKNLLERRGRQYRRGQKRIEKEA